MGREKKHAGKPMYEVGELGYPNFLRPPLLPSKWEGELASAPTKLSWVSDRESIRPNFSSNIDFYTWEKVVCAL